MNNIWILAQATDAGSNSGESEPLGMEDSTATETATTSQDGSNGGTTDEGTQKQTPPGFGIQQVVFMVLIFGVMYLFLFRGPKKKQQEHQKMVSSLSKNDRVRTIGGIYGTVLDVRDDEIVLKIDESTNTKMRVSPQAIGTVLKDKTE